MAILSSGTYTPAALATEYTFYTNTTVGVQTLTVDAAALVTTAGVGEVLELSVYLNVLTAGTIRMVWHSGPMIGPQTFPIKVSPPTLNQFTIEFRIKQTSGTLRAFPWRVETP